MDCWAAAREKKYEAPPVGSCGPDSTGIATVHRRHIGPRLGAYFRFRAALCVAGLGA